MGKRLRLDHDFLAVLISYLFMIYYLYVCSCACMYRCVYIIFCVKKRRQLCISILARHIVWDKVYYLLLSTQGQSALQLLGFCLYPSPPHRSTRITHVWQMCAAHRMTDCATASSFYASLWLHGKSLIHWPISLALLPYMWTNFMLGLWRWIGDHQTPLCFLLSKVATLNKPPLSALGCNLSP